MEGKPSRKQRDRYRRGAPWRGSAPVVGGSSMWLSRDRRRDDDRNDSTSKTHKNDK